MYQASIRTDDNRSDGPPSRKPRARLMIGAGSAASFTGGPSIRRPIRIEDKPISHSPPISKPHLIAQAAHAHPQPRRSTSFNAKVGSSVTRSGGDISGGYVNSAVISVPREPHAGRVSRLALSVGHGGSSQTLAAGHSPLAAQPANLELPGQQQQQQQPPQLDASQGASSGASLPSVQTPRCIRSPKDSICDEPKQQQQEVIALSPRAREVLGTAVPSMTFQQGGERHDTDAYKRLLEQVDSERSARVRDCTKIHMTLDELRGRLDSGLCEAEEAVEARVMSRLGEFDNHSRERMSEQVVLEMSRHFDGTAQIAAAAVKDLEGSFPSAEVIQKLEECLPSAVGFRDVQERLTALETHNTTADTRSLEHLHAFRNECVELCRDTCSDMLQKFMAQSEPRVTSTVHEKLQLDLEEKLGPAEARLRSEMEALSNILASSDDKLIRRIAAVEALCNEGQREMEARIHQQCDSLHLEVQDISAASASSSQALAAANHRKNQIEAVLVDLQAKLTEHQERLHEVEMGLVQGTAGDAAVLKEQGASIDALHRDMAILQASATDSAELLRQTQQELQAVQQTSCLNTEAAHGHHAKLVESHKTQLGHLEAAHSHHANSVESHKTQLGHLEAANSKHASIVESHGSKLSSLETAHDHHVSMVESHNAQLGELATAHKHHLSAIETHRDQLRHLEAGHGHATALVHSHGNQLSSLKDAHSHLANIMESHKAELSDLDDRHARAVESHKQHISDLQAAHGHHASTLESLHHQVNAVRSLDQLVSRLSADMDIIRQQQPDSNRSAHQSHDITGRFEEQTAVIDELRSKIHELEVSSAESAELHKSWKASHQELFQAHTTRSDALEDCYAQHRGDLETLRGQVQSWQSSDERMECLLSDVEALKQGSSVGSNPEAIGRLDEYSAMVTTLSNDLQGMQKNVHNLEAEVQALMELVPQATERHDSQESNGQALQMAEKLEALTGLMSASKEELDILRAQSAEGGDLRAQLGALRLELSQASGAGAKLESLQAAITCQQDAMEAVVSKVTSIMSELDVLKDRLPGDPACHQQDLHTLLEEHMAVLAGFRGELDVLKAGVAESATLHSSWHEASKDISRAAEERHGAHLAKEAEASTERTEMFAAGEASLESTREGQAEPCCSDEDRMERQQLAMELNRKLELGLEQLRVELGASSRRMELQLGQELPEHWDAIFSTHEKTLTSIRGELEDIKAVQEQGLQASEVAEELLCALHSAKEVIGLQEDHPHAAAEMSVTDEEMSKDEATTAAEIASLRGEVGSLKATQDLQSHDLKILENAVTGHFGEVRATLGHVEESIQQLHFKLDCSDAADIGPRVSTIEQARQEDRTAVEAMMAEQRRHENLLTEAGACISRICRFKDKLVTSSTQDGDASEASVSEGGLASVSPPRVAIRCPPRPAEAC